jgi:hypothetical protein
MSRKRYSDIQLDMEQLRDLFKQQINSANRSTRNNFVDALIDNLHEDHLDRLNLLTRCLLGVKETSRLNLDGIYHVDIQDLRTWEFNVDATISAGLTTKFAGKDCLKVKSLIFKPYHQPQYCITVDVVKDDQVVEHHDKKYHHGLIHEDNFPI